MAARNYLKDLDHNQHMSFNGSAIRDLDLVVGFFSLTSVFLTQWRRKIKKPCAGNKTKIKIELHAQKWDQTEIELSYFTWVVLMMVKM